MGLKIIAILLISFITISIFQNKLGELRMQIFKYFGILFLMLYSITSWSVGSLEYDLFDALDRADIEYAKELINKGADVNVKQEPFKQTPIIIAPLRGMDFVKLMLENGADINAKDQDNNTALLNASLYGEVEIVKYLIRHGADVHVVNNDGISVLEASKIAKSDEITSILKANGAKD